MSVIPAENQTADIEEFLEREAAATTYEEKIALGRDVLAWARERFGDQLTIASSMGDEILLHLAGTTAPGFDVFFLDTGYHFPETIGTRDAYAVMLPLSIRTVYPRESVESQDVRFGPRLHDRNPDLCCRMRKVAPLNAALEGYAAWVTGVRRADAATRADAQLIEWDAKRSMLKINPIVGWSHDEADRYAAENGVFLNPLRQLGFASIGCAPCTRAVGEGEDPRAGRWAGQDKVECGLHI
ncbi:MAG TPA: phosphoadenylyl-sulfate reductase [Tetrasphaera sp.]|uniref:Adenosine 5'-phosphosulfate reductase n=1 Tax=Nostocoides vanveenii TaxID=330835 RepID=A0ABP4WDM1_9MICO|nr:phosphoadenylyl-sulfate reductase [Tetrasphaera sp.]HNQ05686.1 phosphoadenylyl-sulfate reductase [Tetrasphaera sp.]